MIKSEIDANVAGIRALSKAGGKVVQVSVSDRERAAMKRKMDAARVIEDRRIDQDE
jgi:4-hydroxy-3-methylbut-2-en-1-yl diphosphate synthase IspG/GcpE